MRTMTHPRYSRLARGFTLIEVAIVLFVLALLGGAILVPLGAQVEQRAYDETTRTMNDARDALLGFVVVNRRLPCPTDSALPNADGLERITAGVCNSPEGFLPWSTLGVGAIDAWGQRFRYRVTLAFANQSPPAATITLLTPGDIRICGTGATNCSTGNVAVILSLGKNQGTCTGLCPDEDENRNSNTTFVSRIRQQPGSGNEFDDVLVWIPATTLFSRMIAANLLP
jgi:prepilin-type N-terminal cleavage/methylation domain-containing protein